MQQVQLSICSDYWVKLGVPTLIKETLEKFLVVALAAVVSVSCSRDRSVSEGRPGGGPVAAMTSAAPAMAPPPELSPALNDLASADLLSRSFADFVSPIDASVGIVAVPVGRRGPVISLGQWKEGPAWSTSKIPLVLAALDEDPERHVTASMQMAITQSDNAAADAVWQSLGPPEEAALKMDKVLRDFGDPTNVESQRLRGPRYSAFGQTTWSLTNQAKFLAAVACSQKAGVVLDLMQQVEPGQRWGLGTISGTRFKGGWGPSVDESRYLIRQFGLIPAAHGLIAVAAAADVNSHTFDGAIPVLDALAHWITTHLSDFPVGVCTSGVGR